MMDERYVAAHIKSKGVIVFTACSHAGVINVLKDASSAFAGVPLYAVMGGSISQDQVPKRSFRKPSMIFRASG
jgi:metal-dependent hydrolase (beta-lactamase superfamily II)